MEPYNPKEFNDVLEDYLEDDRVGRMKNYVSHGRITTYDHCRDVAILSHRINQRLRLKADEEVLLKGAMLHDYYLYDWHDNPFDDNGLHGFSHAEVAAQNAKEDFDIDPQTEHVISSHMWPLNVTRIPRSREAWIVCIADKWVSGLETILSRRSK